MIEEIQNMLGKPYQAVNDQNRKFICWHFCKEVYALLGLSLQHFFHDRELTRIDTPKVPCIVLFHIVTDWHSGVVYPDGLHFIHACPRDLLDPNPTVYVVRKDRLTIWPYKILIEGFYVP